MPRAVAEQPRMAPFAALGLPGGGSPVASVQRAHGLAVVQRIQQAG